MLEGFTLLSCNVVHELTNVDNLNLLTIQKALKMLMETNSHQQE
jgi:hypothetical protein